jgi:FtsZ-interacting cell division protein ZipA
MNELQIGLLVLVIALVLVVLAYNKWEERKYRKTAERIFNTTDADKEADVLLRYPARAAGASGETARPSERYEPGASAAPAVARPGGEDDDNAETSENPVDDTKALWAGIDAIATLELVEPANAHEILASWREAPPRLRKLVRWVGFDEDKRAWTVLSPEQKGAYRRLRAGLQLTDRQGPINAGEFGRFAEIVQQVAKEHMAVANLPDRRGALEQAQQLEQFCYEVDIQIGVNLSCRGAPFPGSKIRTLAEAAGMTLGRDGVYVRRDDDGAIRFSLKNTGNKAFAAESLKTMSTSGLEFLLDVPVTPHGHAVFKQMLVIAKRFADTLDGVLVDDRWQPLSEAQLAQIGQNYVATPQARMAAAGLTAGGALATRLFS